MRNLIIAILFIVAICIGCFIGILAGDVIFPLIHHRTNIEQKDHEMKVMLKGMKYNEYRNIPNNQFGYLIDRIKASERAGKVVQFGQEEFEVSVFDSTDTYPYRLKGKRFSVYINPKDIFPNTFIMLKTWDVPAQDKYNE